MIQTRQNDSDVQVANRQTWTVQAVGQDGTVWAKENGSGRKRQRTVRLPAEYVAEHTHLAYASTAYGVQGATVPASHTVLSDALDAAGVYVGMTRGQQTNRLHVVAADAEDAREQFVTALERDRADRGLVAATQAAREAVAGLAADGPVRLVNAERARLTERIEHADQQAEKWEQVLTALDRQREAHRAESDEQREAVATADARAAQVRSEVVAPLIEQATIDGTAYLTGRERMWEAQTAHGQAGRLRRRAAGRAATEAASEHRATEGRGAATLGRSADWSGRRGAVGREGRRGSGRRRSARDRDATGGGAGPPRAESHGRPADARVDRDESARPRRIDSEPCHRPRREAQEAGRTRPPRPRTDRGAARH